MASVGEQLRAAREARGLSIQQVAETTRLKLVQIEALEKGNYDEFPAPVYARGSLRLYADVVKIDPKPLLELMKEEMEEEKEDVSEGTEHHHHTNVNDPTMIGDSDPSSLHLSLGWRAVLPLLIVGVVLAGCIFGYRLWQSREVSDPLLQLSPGYYQGEASCENVPEVLPLPTVE